MTARKRRPILERVLVDDGTGGAMMVTRVADQPAKLRRALVRLLWDSVADDATCTCEVDDECAQCEAFRALYGRRWPGARKASRTMMRRDPNPSRRPATMRR